MKKIISSILIGFVALVALSCNDEKVMPPKFEVSTTQLACASTEGFLRIIISAPAAWTITNAPDWLTIAPMEGSGTREIKINYTTNERYDPRSGSFVVTCNAETVTVSITQEATANPEAEKK